jgi:hypothetical protein
MVLAVPSAVLSIGFTGAWLFFGSVAERGPGALLAGASFAVAAVGLYVLARAVGWVIAGFSGDEISS